ncbi:Ferredoxin-NADP reductase [Actinopolymorpha cephalotaxi]|uniref:Ferredoxin-NADP reductase n=1 Tax=Actinopolymorpha cephalotaxi TaxID=504797 RepID=A0A1I3BBY1_9ACTN|nr:MOSC and FAD-binding oxidoreductase domain-containing protein [Actinopolymorpha cephalotaxi]NYH86769.1 ferredoxin-NADP reductase/MOSC domain-containing protein YiiM [Actinopolymorpha cephalotaxi]SFH59798.1 Ferredoxin-NADP reductase [Actinopolymorpha cephalotaxi]
MATVRVTSLNVGRPKKVDWDGRRVFTGAWKAPVNDRRRVTRLNVDGDGQGDLDGHGGPNRAVLVYQEQAYEFWRSFLSRSDLSAGSFGENLTLDGYPDDEVCIGDQYRIGTAMFEVSQPRVTCFRVGLRNDEPRLAALMVAHRRPGFYMRVLDEGEIGAGDQVELVRKDPAGLSVADVDALLYLPNPDRARLAIAGGHPALSAGWRDSFASMLEEDLQVGTGLAWKGFRSLRVARVARETPSVSSFYLTDPEGLDLPGARAGQYLTIRIPSAGSNNGLVRNYSLSAPAVGSAYRVSVKKEPGGAFSNLLHETVREGDLLDVAVPRGSFVLRPKARAYVFVSAGIGITPLLPMLARLRDMNPNARVWWLHSTRTLEEYPLLAEVEDLVAHSGAMVKVRTWVTRGDVRGPQATGNLGLRQGRLAPQSIADLGVPRDALAYVCGPSAFIEYATAALVAAGVASTNIASELFGAGAALNPGVVASGPSRRPHLPETLGTGPMVTFARSQLQVPWDSNRGSLLELAEACDVPTRWVCRTGVCHTCVTPLVSGELAYIEEPLVPPEDGEALICCSRPASEVVLDL